MPGVQDRVIVVSGAGGGLGREYALTLAKEGASVVVNDLGGARDGTGAGHNMADEVVNEIKAAGGRAVANYDSVAESEGAENIIKTAIDEFGKVDGVVSNAGILRDGTFHKMTFEQWDAVLKVHLYGGYNVIRAAWPHFREQSFGRVVVATSTSGLFGNFGQANYGAAKLGLVGLINTLAQEGAKYNIKTNAVAPIAATRMTQDILPPEVFEKLTPEYVAPVVAYLCTEELPETASVFIVGGGRVQRVALFQNAGVTFTGVPSVDDVAVKWGEITDLSAADPASVVIDVGAAGVCFPDLLLLRGQYQLRLEPPFIPGMEVAGVVRSAPNGSGFTAGQRVSAFTLMGGYAEQVAVAPDSVVSTPADLDDAAAASLLGNYYTMYFALQRRGALRAGETVLVLGSAGGVGTAAIQIAKALGAKVIAMVHRPSAIEFVESLGADVVLPLTDGWLDTVKQHTGGQGVDLVVDPIGGEAFDDAIRALATEGRLLVIGFAAGGIPTVKVNRLLLRNVAVIGVGYGEYVNRRPGSQSVFEFGVAELVKAGLRPPPPVRFPLSKGAVALQSLADGGVLGKVVLEP